MKCYICHRELNNFNVHPFYKRMCLGCGDRNWMKREEYASLAGYNALVTGGRVKIGYETALKLLRSGAFVIITTRFPVDAAKRYSEEKDFNDWFKRLRIYQIDFRKMQSLFTFVNFLYDGLEHLDILINNAAQTVRHDLKYYRDLCEMEENEYESLPEVLKTLIIKQLDCDSFEKIQNSLDQLMSIAPAKLREGNKSLKLQEYQCNNYELLEKNSGKRSKNSWISKACDISLVELLEVQLVNSTAPYILCTSLRYLMEQSPYKYKYIINVSAMEGKFSKRNKNCFHPHTNMAKASLNMLTRTSSQDFIDSGILMNSVDTGWITDENPEWLRSKNEQKGLIPPLDAKDGASRLCDPIFASVNREKHIYGAFLKNYARTGW